MTNTASFAGPNFDYAADLAAIERQRKLAEALQAQSMEAMPQQMAGGWVLPTSPLQGIGKMAQAWSARANQTDADRRQREISSRAQRDLTSVLSQASEAYAGAPAIAAPADDIGGGPGRPAMAPDPMKAASLYMTHPMTAGLGTQLLGQEMTRTRLLQALRGPQAPAAGAPAESPRGAAPGAPQAAIGGAVSGLPLETWLAIDPTGKAYVQRLAEMGEVQGGMNYDQQGRAFVITKGGQPMYLPGITSRDKMELANTGSALVPYNPYSQREPIPLGLTPAQERQIPIEEAKAAAQVPGYTHRQPTGGAPQLPAGAVATPKGDFVAPTAAVPQSDMEAFRKVASGEVTSARGLTPGMTPEQQATLDAKRSAEAPQARQQVDLQIQDLDRLVALATELSGHKGLSRASGVMGAVPSIPGLPAANAEALIDSLKSQVAGMKIQAMRNASKTGGAVGQVTEKEWPRLENMVVALDPVKMGAETFRAKLGELTREIAKIKGVINEAFTAEYGAAAAGRGPAADDPLGIRRR